MSVKILIDYSLDASGFFASTTRRDVLKRAADTLANRLGDTLSAIVPGGTNTWSANFTNPASGAAKSIANLSIPADTVRVYVGARSLGTGQLAHGGPSGWSANGSSTWLATVRGRGESGALATTKTDFAPAVGSIAFNSSSTWFFGATTSGLSTGQNDFFSVAMHELGHVFGVGTAPSWTAKVSGSTFIGSKSTASYGAAVPLTGDRAHWAEGTKSGGIEAAMDPTLLTGKRKNFTPLDFAGLDDIGWDILPPPPASIAGTVYNDLDSDGVRDTGEAGLAGIRVFIDTDKDGIWDSTEKNVLSDTAGNYKLTGLAAGTYRVRHLKPSGYRAVSPSIGYHTITLATSQIVTGKHFADTQKILISGTVFNDANGDRIRNSGEVGLANWRVFIDSDSDGVWDSTEKYTFSDGSGNYSFKTLSAGTYRVRVVQQSGWTRTTPTAGYHGITLSAGQASTGKLFGERRIV
jgi:hypothetical protein